MKDPFETTDGDIEEYREKELQDYLESLEDNEPDEMYSLVDILYKFNRNLIEGTVYENYPFEDDIVLIIDVKKPYVEMKIDNKFKLIYTNPENVLNKFLNRPNITKNIYDSDIYVDVETEFKIIQEFWECLCEECFEYEIKLI